MYAANFLLTIAPGYLALLQVGIGCPGGCKAAVHSARVLEAMPRNSVLIKLNFSNTFKLFNSMLRDSMLMALANFMPELSAYGLLSYDNLSLLKFGPSCYHLKWAHNREPLRPLLLCLPMQTVLQKLKAAL